MDNHYARLGVSPGATKDEIQDRYDFLKEVYDPIKFRSDVDRAFAQEMSSKLDEAFRVLCGAASERTLHTEHIDAPPNGSSTDLPRHHSRERISSLGPNRGAFDSFETWLGWIVICGTLMLLLFLGSAALKKDRPSSSTSGQSNLPQADSPSLPSTQNNRDGTAAYPLRVLSEVFPVPASEAHSAQSFKVLRDLRVEVDGTSYLIKAGEVFPLAEADEKEVQFSAGEHRIALPVSFVERLENAKGASSIRVEPLVSGAESSKNKNSQTETPAEVTRRAKTEAVRRYPALGRKDSAENQLYVETYQELTRLGASDFFSDPQWPLQLAELLAKREGWKKVE